MEIRTANKNKDKYWFELNITTVFDSNNNFINFIGVGRNVTQRIEKEFELRDLEMKKISKQAKEIQTYFDKEGMAVMDAEHRSKERELANLNVSLQRMQREFREDLNLRKNEELALVLARANKAIKAIAESEKFDLVLQEAVYRNPKIDITEKVLQYLAAEK